MGNGSTALVTGGSRGIGRAVAMQLARDGFDVGFCYLADKKNADLTAARIRELGRLVISERTDVRKTGEVRRLIEQIEDRLGPLFAVVNCAGIRMDGLMLRMTERQWIDVLETNLNGTYNVTRSVIPGMMKRRSGVIINITSVSGIEGNAGQTNYAAAKAGTNGFTLALAKEMGRFGIRANVVAPGLIETDMLEGFSETRRSRAEMTISLRRFGEPQDVANAVSFLVSARASYITGIILRVDGGFSVGGGI